MSNAIKQLFIIGAVIAIIMVFVIQFRPGTEVQSPTGPRCAVEVSGACIPHSEYMAAYRLIAPPNADDEALARFRMRELVVNGLIERWALLRDAERLGIEVSEDDITRQIGSGFARVSVPRARAEEASMSLGLVPAPEGPARNMFIKDRKTGKFDYEKYRAAVPRLSGLTLADFRDFQRKEIIAARVRALVKGRVRVSDGEGYRLYARANEKAKVRYLKLERAYYRDYVIDRSPDAINKWLEANKKEADEAWDSRKSAFLPECRRARHILMRVDGTADDKDAAKAKAKAAIEAAAKRIEDGEDFAAVAKELSQDSSNRAQGGDLGCFGKGKMAKPFEEAVFSMKEGGISAPVETTYGFHLIKLEKIASGDDAETVGRFQTGRDLYLRKEAERLASEGAKQILAAVAGGKKIEEALDTYLMAALPEPHRAAYAAGKAAGDGEEKKDEGDDDKKDEGDDEKDDEGEDDAKSKLPNAWSDPGRPRIETSNAFGRRGPPFGGVQSPVSAASALFDLQKPGDVPADVIKLYDGYAVAQLAEKIAVKKEEWDKQRVDLLRRMREQKQRDALYEYVSRLRDKHAKEVKYLISLDVPSRKQNAKPGEKPAPKK